MPDVPGSDTANSAKVDAYIERHARWHEPLADARRILVRAGLDESVKWGGPAYSLDGRVLIGLAAYKNHCAIWFHHGVFLADARGRLRNAQDSTRGMRQWRLEAGDTLPPRIFAAYVREAIANERSGKRIQPKRSAEIAPPKELAQALAADVSLAAAFAALTPGRQREYCRHVAEAKREATRLARVDKLIPGVLAGAGLHDKYRS